MVCENRCSAAVAVSTYLFNILLEYIDVSSVQTKYHFDVIHAIAERKPPSIHEHFLLQIMRNKYTKRMI